MTRNVKLFALMIMAAISLGIMGCGGHDKTVSPAPPSSANAVPGARFSAIPSNGTKMVIKNN